METTTNFGLDTPDDTDLVKDGAAAIRTLGSSIDTSFVDLKGGTTDQVLAKNSGTDLDFKWVTDATGMANPMTTTGDSIYSSSGSTPARLGIGTTGQVLTVAAGVPSWATPTGANKSYSLLSTTALTGATTITVTGLSGYDNFVIQVQNGAGVNVNNQAVLRINTDSGTNYTYAGMILRAASSYAATYLNDSFSNGATSFPLAVMTSGAGQTNFSGGIAILGGNSTGFKAVSVNGTADVGQAAASTDQAGYNYQGIYKGTAVISSISIISLSGNFSQGNVYVYGAV